MTQFDEDYEIEALAKCSKALFQLDEKARIRVFKYLIDKFELMRESNEPAQEEDFISQTNENNLLLSQSNDQSSYGESNLMNSKENVPINSIKDLVLRSLTQGDQDIVLIACYISSNYGADFFSRQSIIETLKEHDVFSNKRSKGLSTHLINLTKKVYISSFNDNQYMITKEGNEACNNILKGNSTTIKRKQSTRKSKTSNQKNKEVEKNPQENNDD